jgi:signal transduction histidine kinase
VSAEIPGRLEAAVESAAYFAVSEIFTNAAKHSGAQRVWMDLRHENGMLRILITDDGSGGADPSRGSGLRGIERRLGTFDGVLAVNSPAGGPTIVTMELPCVLTAPQR